MERNNGNRAEALRWLNIAEKLLAARDLYGTRSFAIRARESDPIVLEAADRVIAVADTLLAAESRIQNQHDWYAILQISQPTQSIELIATQYRRLALLLHPETNRVAFSDHAFRLVSDAWCVLSNPLRKALYDNEYLMFSKFTATTTGSSQLPKSPQHQPQPQPPPPPPPPPQPQHQHQPQPQFPQPIKTSPRKDIRMMESQPPPPPLPPVPQPKPLERSQPVPQPTPQPQPQPQPQRQPQPVPQPTPQQHQFISRSPKSVDGKVAGEEERPNGSDVPESTRETQQEIESNRARASVTEPTESTTTTTTTPPPMTEPSIPSFWTACPYCYNLYEYPKGYEDCVLRCQNCAKAFQAVVIPSPPVAGKDATFCCWGFFPLGISVNAKRKMGSAAWSPFSAMFTCPLPGQGGTTTRGKIKNPTKKSAPRVYREEDDVYVAVSDSSDSSDVDWRRVNSTGSKKKKSRRGFGSRNDKRPQSESLQRGNRGNGGSVNNDKVENMEGQFGEQNGMVQLGLSNSTRGESSKKVAAGAGGGGKKHKGKGAKELGKLDLNVEFSNEVEEPATGVSGHGEDNIGSGFFEGLDEFLSSLPILNAVADDKVKAS